MLNSNQRMPWLLAIVALGTLSIGCSHVNRDELATELTVLEEDLRAADQELAGRIDRVDGRVGEVEAEVEANRARLESLERDLETLRQEFDVTVRRMEGMIAFDVPVHFDFDASTLRDHDKPVLDRFATVVQHYYGNSLITVEGFTDPAGSQAYNLRLGQRRAEEVKSYLTEVAGLEGMQIRAVSYGEAPERQVRPGARGPGEEGLENRRVTLVIDYHGDDVAVPTGGANDIGS